MTIRELRKVTGMTQTQFSIYTGIPFRTIQNWELGTRKAPDYVLKMLERIVLEDFVSGKEPPAKAF